MQDKLKEQVLKAKEKPAPYGLDFDLNQFVSEAKKNAYQTDLNQMNPGERLALENAGMDVSCKERSGSYVLMDTSTVHCNITQPGLDVMEMAEAIKELPDVRDYLWRAVQPDADKFTANSFLNPIKGYFIRAKSGTKALFPVQACLYMGQDGIAQYVHNIVVAEEGSELDVITGCTTGPELRSGLHVGVSEFFIKKGAKVTFTMIHNWAEDVIVRPRTGIILEESATFLSNYVSMKRVKSVQMYPVAYLKGEGAVARFNSILVGPLGSDLDIGAKVVLQAKGAKAEIISRAISTGGSIKARGYLQGEVEDIKAHLECRGLILTDEGQIYAVPELDGRRSGVDLSHEAAVGKIAREEIEYLMARGLSEDEATSIIVRGFLNVEIVGLSAGLKSEIDRVIQECEKDLL